MNDFSPAPRRKSAPGWLAPVLAVALVLALVWGLGLTLFRGVLENRGLPEEIRGASDQQFAQWEFGTQLANLASQSRALAELADGDVAVALQALDESLTRSADLLGQLRYADEQPMNLPVSYSPEAAATLAAAVIAVDSRAPLGSGEDRQASSLLVRIVFETGLDARSVITAAHPQTHQDAGAVPLAATEAAGEQTATLECLSDPALLAPQAGIPGGTETAPVLAARALDRGYALDYVLQLRAARGPARVAPQIEAQRQALNEQLALLRTAVDGHCADLRQLAYQLPEGALEDLAALSADLQVDLTDELLLAVTAARGEARQILAATAWNLLTARQDAGQFPQLLNNE